MTEFSDIEQRLRAYGSQPVDSALQSQHLTRIAELPVRRASGIAQKVRVAAALVVGLFVGSTGLAMAGALPDAAQNVAHDTVGQVLSKAGIHVPVGTDRFQGDGTEACEGAPWKNHGQYVKAQPKESRAEASNSRCGKPLKAGAGDEGTTEGDEGPDAQSNDPNECAAGGQAIAADAKARKGAPDEPGKPAHAGQPDPTGKPECTPANEAEEGDANDAVANDNSEAGEPADPEAKPVDTPVGPPDEAGTEAGDSQGAKDETPGDDAGSPVEEAPPGE